MLGADRAAPPVVAPLPQVDLVSSVPTRAADAHVLARAGRRAGRGGRQDGAGHRVAAPDGSVAGDVRRRPLGATDGPRAARRARRGARRRPPSTDARSSCSTPSSSPRRGRSSERLTALLAEAGDGRRVPVGDGRARAAQHGRVAQRLRRRATPRSTRSTRCIADLAAFIGLWDESTVHGPAWRFGDLGRRIERSSVVLGLVDACLAARSRRQLGGTTPGRCGSRPTTSSTGRRWRCCWRPTRASSPTAATTAATSSRTPAIAPPAPRPRQPALVPGVGRPARRARRGDRLDGGPPGRRRTGRRSSTTTTSWPASARRTPRSRTSARSSSRRGSRRRSTRPSCAAGSGDGGGRAGRRALPRLAPHDVRVRRCRWPTATPSPTCCRGRRAHQVVEAAEVTVDPAPDERAERIDVFGNRVLQLGVHHAHDTLTLHAESEVVVEPGDGRRRPVSRGRSPRGASPSCAAATRWPCGRSPAARRTCPSATTARRCGRSPRRRSRPHRPVVDAAPRAVPRHLRDVRRTTRRSPTCRRRCRRCSSGRRGVCQDFAHLAAGCLRSLGLAARYVSGYIETDPPPGRPRLVGADASHAWCSRLGARSRAGSTSTRRTTTCRRTATSRWRGVATTATSPRSAASSSARPSTRR